jgi:hypothetical protein
VGTATITGAVEDATSARIAGARIKLVSLRTGTENDAVSGRYGRFVISGILPGSYLLEITRNGFATIQFAGLTLNIGDLRDILIRMKIGSVDETVLVNGSGMAVDTTDASISTVVDQTFVSRIPLNGRSFQDLISMTPGAETQSPQTPGQGDISINGQKADTNTFSVDGVSANIGAGSLSGQVMLPAMGQYAGTTAIGTTQSLASLDDLEEFRVLSSSYSAEYGHTPGAQFSLLTKAGTKDLHGSIYVYARNGYFDARDWYTGYYSTFDDRNGSFSQQDFGGTLGGPIRIPRSRRGKEKTFFFGSYEGLRVSNPTAPFVQYAPDQATLLNAPLALRSILQSFPGQTAPPSTSYPGLSPSFYGVIFQPSRIEAGSLRLDHTFNSRLSMFARYSNAASRTQMDQSPLSWSNSLDTQTLTLGGTLQISPRMLNDLRLGFARTDGSSRNAADIGSSFCRYFGVESTTGGAACQMYIRIAGIGEAATQVDAAEDALHQWNLRNTTVFQLGRHLLRIGIDERRLRTLIRPPALSVTASYLSQETILQNQASNLVISRRLAADPLINEFAAFAQDEWQLSPSLNISAGLRWELNPAPGEAHGRLPYVVRGSIQAPATLTLAPRGTSLWDTNWRDFAPRLGVAWKADRSADHELLLRAGAGIYFDNANRAAAGSYTAFGFSTSNEPSNPALPLPSSAFDLADSLSMPTSHGTVYIFPSHLTAPYFLQWNTSLEKAFGRNQSATISWVGAEGRHLLLPQRADVSNSNPDFSAVYYFPSGLRASYESLQMRFQRTISRGLQALASYTWSHTLDYGSTAPAYPLTYGNSDLDVRHNLQLALSWDTSRSSDSPKRKDFYARWGFDARFFARTAFPVTLLGNLEFDSVTGERYYSGVNRMPGRVEYLYGSQYPGGRAINGGPDMASPAFQLPAAGQMGNVVRNQLRGFGASQFNIAVRKDIPLHDMVNFQFRAETFNLFNHPDLGYIDPHITDQFSGKATLMLNQSFGSNGSLYQQGGPRSLQFMVRLRF